MKSSRRTFVSAVRVLDDIKACLEPLVQSVQDSGTVTETLSLDQEQRLGEILSRPRAVENLPADMVSLLHALVSLQALNLEPSLVKRLRQSYNANVAPLLAEYESVAVRGAALSAAEGEELNERDGEVVEALDGLEYHYRLHAEVLSARPGAVSPVVFAQRILELTADLAWSADRAQGDTKKVNYPVVFKLPSARVDNAVASVALVMLASALYSTGSEEIRGQLAGQSDALSAALVTGAIAWGAFTTLRDCHARALADLRSLGALESVRQDPSAARSRTVVVSPVRSAPGAVSVSQVSPPGL